MPLPRASAGHKGPGTPHRGSALSLSATPACLWTLLSGVGQAFPGAGDTPLDFQRQPSQPSAREGRALFICAHVA